MSKDKLPVTDQELSDLVTDLEEMLNYLEEKIESLDHLVRSAEPDHKGPAAAAYKKLQRDAYMDAVRVRQLLTRTEEATKQRGESLSPRYLDLLHRFQSLQKPSEEDRDEDGDA
ncbi:hypothetical protein [Streptomyces sp. NPDC005336]|uniref:hypothetical protein n=1 Tax=unclassified Streptomyces TaxID=2593676 RepID=UPI0033A21DA9